MCNACLPSHHRSLRIDATPVCGPCEVRSPGTRVRMAERRSIKRASTNRRLRISPDEVWIIRSVWIKNDKPPILDLDEEAQIDSQGVSIMNVPRDWVVPA